MGLTEAGAADQPRVLQLMREFYEIERLAYDFDVASRALGDLWNHPARGRIFLIEDAGVVVGYVVVAFGFSLEFHGRDALVDELYIREAHRRRGLGSDCLSRVEEICRRDGIRAVHLEVDRTNLPVKEWYHRMGFVDHDRHLLTKWLDPH